MSVINKETDLDQMIELKSTPKLGNGNMSRSVAPLDTYQRILPLMPAAGLSHVVDVTSLDILGIPIFVGFGSDKVDKQLSNFVDWAPRPFREKVEYALANADRFPSQAPSKGSKPVFVAGKGPTNLEAKVSAMMEAIERFSARYPSCQPVVGSYSTMLKRGDIDVLDPRALILISPDAFDADQELEWVLGTELGTGKEVWVPADAATLSYQPSLASRVCSDTPTGLGAGNTMEEAVSHGLAEAIEHDSWTLAVVRNSFSSAKNGLLDILFGKAIEDQPASKVLEEAKEASFIRLDLTSIEHIQPLAELISQIRKAGIQLNVYVVTSDIEIPTFSVSVAGFAEGQDGGGLGAHPDARVAFSRAVTEAAQQRIIMHARSFFPQAQLIARWQPIFGEQANAAPGEAACRFSDVTSFSASDILDDIHYMLDTLASQGLNQVIVVDLTKPEFNIPVVKVIVPGLADYWTSSTVPDWRALGSRVRRYI